jgi:hypothetical protein
MNERSFLFLHIYLRLSSRKFGESVAVETKHPLEISFLGDVDTENLVFYFF